LGGGDGGDSQDVVRYSKWCKREAEEGNHCDSFLLQERVDCLEIPEDPGRSLNLLSDHLLEQVPRKREGNERPSEDSKHRHGYGEEEAFDLTLEHLGVSEAQHDVVQCDWHRED